MALDNTKKKKDNLIDYSTFSEKRLEEEFKRDAIQLLKKYKEGIKSIELENVDSDIQKRIGELERRCMKQQKKLQHCIPTHTIIYLIVNAVVVALSLCLLVLRMFFNVYVIDSYYLICTLLVGTTLFATAAVSLFEWKKYMSEE